MATSFFTAGTYAFLGELAAHNERGWFNERKARYESVVREPALAFIRAVAPRLQALSSHFVASDKKIGGSLMRIYRDTRFSKDKRPYKTNIGIQFRHAAGKDVHAPGFYVHVAPEGSFLGVGLWRPDNAVLNRIRAKIDAEQDRWRGINAAAPLSDHFTPHDGEALKRPPRGYAKDHPLLEDLKRKSHIVSADLASADVTSNRLVDVVMDRFECGRDYIRFLCEAVEVPF